MKKIMLVGKTGSGKTSLTQRLMNQEIDYKKTQAIEFCGGVIDTPGEYVENRMYYKALIVSACDVDVVALVQDAVAEDSLFPPEFATAFNKEVIGIVTKIDKASHTECAKDYLKRAGAQKIFEISNTEDIGIDELKSYLRTIS